MTKLSDTQALILSAAAQRPEHIALPLPDSLRGGAAAKVVGAMLAKGFLQEVDADLPIPQGPGGRGSLSRDSDGIRRAGRSGSDAASPSAT